jgi:hypothetical protein
MTFLENLQGPLLALLVTASYANPNVSLCDLTGAVSAGLTYLLEGSDQDAENQRPKKIKAMCQTEKMLSCLTFYLV